MEKALCSVSAPFEHLQHMVPGRWRTGAGVLGSKCDGQCTVFSNAYFCMSSNVVVCLCNVVVVVVVVVVVAVMWHVVNVKS